MIKACIFDLDGVIVDTAKYHFIAWQRLANELGIELTKEENENLKGVSRMETLEIILTKGNQQNNFTQEEKVALSEKKNDWYREFITKMDESEVLPGVIEFLDTLQANNYKIALGSASRNAPTILEVTKMTHYFEVIIDGNKTTRSKPDPQVFQMGAAGLGVEPNEAVVFEDSYKGVDAALAGGFYAIGIGSPEKLGKANFVLDGLDQMNLGKLTGLSSITA
jgi:beta-phosphoglucomutase